VVLRIFALRTVLLTNNCYKLILKNITIGQDKPSANYYKTTGNKHQEKNTFSKGTKKPEHEELYM